MHYSLQEQQTTLKASTLEEFITLLKGYSYTKQVDALPPEECSLCAIHKIDITRSCKISPYPCEGHECGCFTNLPNSTASNQNNTNLIHEASTTSSSCPTLTNTNFENTSPTIQYYPACFKCVANVLYSKTNSFMRENGRWRANCPFCKAEFCHLDLIIASGPPPTKSKRKKGKKKGKNKKS